MNDLTERNLIEQGFTLFAELQAKLTQAINTNDDFDYTRFERYIIHVNNWYREFRKATRMAMTLEVKILELNDRMHAFNRLEKTPVKPKVKSNFISKFFGAADSTHSEKNSIEVIEHLSRIKLLTIKISDDLKKYQRSGK